MALNIAIFNHSGLCDKKIIPKAEGKRKWEETYPCGLPKRPEDTRRLSPLGTGNKQPEHHHFG